MKIKKIDRQEWMMSMKTEVMQNAEYYMESYALLHYIANEKEVDQEDTEFIGRYPNCAELKKKYELLKKIEKYAINHFPKEDYNQIEYYFKELKGVQGVLARFCTLRKEYDCGTLEEARKAVCNMNEKDFCKDFVASILNDFEDYTEIEKKVQDKLSALEFINSMNVPAEEKMSILDIFLCFKKHNEIVLELIGKGIHILEHFKKEIDEQYAQLRDYWSKRIAKEDFIELVKNNLQFSLEANALGSIIVPQIIASRSIYFAAYAEDYIADFKTPYIVRVGMMFGEELPFSIVHKEEMSTEKLCQFLKLMSDTSKFEIMQYIKDKPAYGVEIAQKMNLTAATISHHMSALLQIGLVELTQDEKRIYYKVNQNTMNHYIEELKSKLL